MIKAENLSVRLGDKDIIKNLSFSVDENKTYCIMGRSGIGKTTLLRTMADLIKPTEGKITGIGNGRCSFIFQENRLLPHLSVYENIRYVTDDEEKITEALKKTGLYDEKDKKVTELSGGMERRAAIARAVAYGGDVFFIDEPLYGLDTVTAEGILSLIKQTTTGKTSFIITHSADEAFYLADTVILLSASPVTDVTIKPVTDFSSPEELKRCLEK